MTGVGYLMTQAGETKRQNFNVTPEQEAQIERLREALGAASALIQPVSET